MAHAGRFVNVVTEVANNNSGVTAQATLNGLMSADSILAGRRLLTTSLVQTKLRWKAVSWRAVAGQTFPRQADRVATYPCGLPLCGGNLFRRALAERLSFTGGLDERGVELYEGVVHCAILAVTRVAGSFSRDRVCVCHIPSHC